MARHANFRDRVRPTKARPKANPAHERRQEPGRSATLLEADPERTPDVVDELEREGVLAGCRDRGEEW